MFIRALRGDTSACLMTLDDAFISSCPTGESVMHECEFDVACTIVE